jgi:hypothetical protein
MEGQALGAVPDEYMLHVVPKVVPRYPNPFAIFPDENRKWHFKLIGFLDRRRDGHGRYI